MKSVAIYGAGSIGNHLAFACRSKGWDVVICDIDSDALERTRNDIYPERYGQWDKNIKLIHLKERCLKEKYDLVIIGTPPDTHIEIALDVLNQNPPEIMLIEKPLCALNLENCQQLIEFAKKAGTRVLVGYNHTLTEHTRKADELLKKGLVGKPLYMYAAFREHWEGIFQAHPWLSGPQDTYLGYFSKGGGAGGEHSHALNIWQHFAHILDMGRVAEVSSMLDIVKDGSCEYDRIFQVNLRSEKGLLGQVTQDVITKPSKKFVSLQGDKGGFEWQVNWNKGIDSLHYTAEGGSAREELFSKARPDDFKGEIDHIELLFNEQNQQSPIDLNRGLETMLVLAAAHHSHKTRHAVRIDYQKGYALDALEIVK